MLEVIFLISLKVFLVVIFFLQTFQLSTTLKLVEKKIYYGRSRLLASAIFKKAII